VRAFKSRIPNLRAVVGKNGNVLAPHNVPIAALLDARRLVAELEMAARALDLSFCVFLCDQEKPRGVDDKRGPLYALSAYCSALIKRAPQFADRCIESHWAAAKQAAPTGRPTRASCACGEGLLLACPVYLISDDLRDPKMCITATVYPRTGVFPPEKLSQITGVPEPELRSLIAEVGSRALPTARAAAIRKGLQIIAGSVSAEMSSRYQLYREIAARTEAEQRLLADKRQLELYRKLVDNVDDFVLMADNYGRILAANRKLRELLRYDQEDLRQLNAGLLHPREDLPKALELVEEARRQGTTKGRIRLLTRDGRQIPTEVLLCFSPEEATFQAIFRDITDRVEMENELRRRSVQLEKQHRKVLDATQLKSRFFASMSHELRTPLTSIIGFTEMMSEDGDGAFTAQHRAHLARISQNAHQLAQMVDDLLDIAKIESGRISVSLSNVDIGRIVREVTASIAPMASAKGNRLRAVVRPALPPAFTDEQKLGQILRNLLSNAVKFTEKGIVTVSAGVSGDRLRISVKDTGPGISKSDFRRMFEEFEQLDAAGGRKAKGTGLGLPLTRRLCHLLGGSIKVESEVGRGSTFTVLLPVNLSESVIRRRSRSLSLGRF